MTTSPALAGMTDRRLLETLNQFGDVLKHLGEDYVAISFRRGDDLLPNDRFIATVSIKGAPAISASAATAAGAFIRAVADRSDKEQELEIEADVRREVAARMERRAA